ncbi:hypothetical protein BVG79_p1000036 (plasmid) [Ketogulonicigenium robustum]|uniref:Uncharacterized protein n=1 Tax=Ketogulonicigenium robustum TaxID=92947 RepID=A0A1W6P2U3_9RHOB|nr:hypothetical protein [Ketogulonicigenium robustum]ARO15838.1 hypothetical protein BVG79_p1000036 [Ketogulonicigenium robustum]
MTIRLPRRSFLLGTLAAGLLPAAAQAQIHERVTLTPKGALAEVTSARVQDDVLRVTARFTAMDATYQGEVIYDALTPSQIIAEVYLKAGDRDYGVISNGGVYAMPDRLELRPHSGGTGREVVGEWTADFLAPTPDLREITLLLPAMLPIGRFTIRHF